MEREYLVEGLIVVVVLLVVAVGFLSLFPEARDSVKDFSSDVLGLGFAKSPEQIRASVKLMRDSLDACSSKLSKGCRCVVDMDVMPSDYFVVVDNGRSESDLLLLNPSQQVDSTLPLAGRKIGVPVVAFEDSEWRLYCSFDDIVLSYDSGWKRRQGGSEVDLVSTDDVSLYSVIKMEDGNFCFVDEYLLGIEKGKDELGSSLGEQGITQSVKMVGRLPLLEGTFSDYYSGADLHNNLHECS